MPLCFLKYGISYYRLCTANFGKQKKDEGFINTTKKSIKPTSSESSLKQSASRDKNKINFFLEMFHCESLGNNPVISAMA